MYSWPAGTYAVTNTPISSVQHNTALDDLGADLNAPRPISAGGTGATSPASAFEAISPMTARGDLITRDATASKRLPIGAAGTVLSSDGLDPAWKTGANIWTDIQQPASETAAGTLEIATEAENAARASALLAVTPKYNPLHPGFLFGCTLSNAATDLVNDITIAAGKARDATDAVNLILAIGLTKRLDANWAVGDAQGGLDTGSIANTTYHVWLIKRSDTGVVDALFSASATTPTMPANYTTSGASARSCARAPTSSIPAGGRQVLAGGADRRRERYQSRRRGCHTDPAGANRHTGRRHGYPFSHHRVIWHCVLWPAVVPARHEQRAVDYGPRCGDSGQRRCIRRLRQSGNHHEYLRADPLRHIQLNSVTIETITTLGWITRDL